LIALIKNDVCAFLGSLIKNDVCNNSWIADQERRTRTSATILGSLIKNDFCNNSATILGSLIKNDVRARLHQFLDR
jgi:hypothetical protein